MAESDKNDLEIVLAPQIHPLIGFIRERFRVADRARRYKQDQWIRNLRALRAEDSDRPLRPETEISKIYVRTTNTKTRAAYAQINEALLANEKFPISVATTPMPTGIAEFAHVKTPEEAPSTQRNPLDVGFEGDGRELQPGATQGGDMFGDAYTDMLDRNLLEEGKDPLGNGAQISPAKEAARKMEKLIQDQLTESKATHALRRALYEMCILGTGVMKGPFSEIQTLNQWVNGQYQPTEREFPQVSYVSLWDIYVDPNAYNPKDIQWIIERHRFNLNQLQDLKRQPLFDHEAIGRLTRQGGNYEQETHEHEIHENNETHEEDNLFEVFEFWGYVKTADARRLYELDIPEDAGDVVQLNVWTSGHEVLRVNVNPFIPARIPYFIFPYEEDPYSIYGTGVPELMEDLQYLMNGMVRLSVENAMLAGNVILDVDKSALAGEQDMSVYPGKIFERQTGAAGNAINSITVPFVAHNNMEMFRQYRQMADESTGIQSISHGQTGVSGTGRTASGLSMLLDSASLSIKNVVRNIDEYLLKPMATSYFQWNMQFSGNEHPEIKGDLEIKGMGTHNLVTKERKAQSLQTFLQLSTNPAIAPLIRLPTVIKDLAVQMDVDPDEILNSPEEAVMYAKLMEQSNPGGAAQQPAAPTDPRVPSAGDPGFTGNNEGAGNAAGVQGEQIG